MKSITVREASRHFSRHADLTLEGEVVRVLKDGKPYVRIVADLEVPKACPKIDYAKLARKTYGGRSFKVDLPAAIIKNRSIYCDSSFLRSSLPSMRISTVWR